MRIEMCSVLLCVAVIFSVSLADDEDARVFTFLVAANILARFACFLELLENAVIKHF